MLESISKITSLPKELMEALKISAIQMIDFEFKVVKDKNFHVS